MPTNRSKRFLCSSLTAALLTLTPVWGAAQPGAGHALEHAGAQPSGLAQLDWLARSSAGWIKWTGTVRPDIDRELRAILELQEADLAESLATELERTSIFYKADRDLDRACRRVAAVWVRAHAEESEAALATTDVFTAIHEARLTYALNAGVGAGAVFENLDHVSPAVELIAEFVEVEHTRTRSMTSVIAGGVTAAQLVANMAQAPGVQSLVASWQSEAPALQGASAQDAYVAKHFGSAGPELRKLVIQSVQMSNLEGIYAAGRGGFAVLAELAISATDAPGTRALPADVPRDVVVRFLYELNSGQALALFCDWYPESKDRFRWALAGLVHDRSIRPAWIEPSSGASLENGVGWYVLVEPRIAELALHLLNTSGAESAGFVLVDQIAGLGQLSAPLVERLSAILAGDDRNRAGEALGALDVEHRSPSLLPAFVAGLQSPFADVRSTCGARLMVMGAGPELRALWNHFDPELRKLAARAHGTFEYRVLAPSANRGSAAEHYALDGKDVAIVEQLLTADPNEGVRARMAESLARVFFAEEALDALLASTDSRLRERGLKLLAARPPSEQVATLRTLLADPDPVRRGQLLGSYDGNRNGWSFEWSVEALGLVLATFAQDPDATLRNRVDAFLVDRSGGLKSVNSSKFPELLERVLVARDLSGEPRQTLNTGADWLEFVRIWRLDFNSAPFLLGMAFDKQIDALIVDQVASAWTAGNTLNETAASLLHLAPSQRRVLYDLEPSAEDVARLGSRWNQFEQLRESMVGLGRDDLDAARLALTDVGAGGVPSAWALQILDGSAAELDDVRHALIADPNTPLAVRARVGARLALDLDARKHLPAIWQGVLALEGAQRRPALSSVIQWIASTEDPGGVLMGLELSGLTANELDELLYPLLRNKNAETRAFLVWVVEQLLAREGGGTRGFASLPRALGVLEGKSLDAAGRAVLVKAAADLRYREQAIETMSKMPSLDYVDTAFAILGGPSSIAELSDALMVLRSAPSEENVARLEVWKQTAPETLLAATLNTITSMRARLEPEAKQLPSKVEATAQLIDQLENGVAFTRGAAARGLAKLGALEALPLLLTAYAKETDAGARKQIEQALEVLLAPED